MATTLRPPSRTRHDRDAPRIFTVTHVEPEGASLRLFGPKRHERGRIERFGPNHIGSDTATGRRFVADHDRAVVGYFNAYDTWRTSVDAACTDVLRQAHNLTARLAALQPVAGRPMNAKVIAATASADLSAIRAAAAEGRTATIVERNRVIRATKPCEAYGMNARKIKERREKYSLVVELWPLLPELGCGTAVTDEQRWKRDAERPVREKHLERAAIEGLRGRGHTRRIDDDGEAWWHPPA